MGSKNSFINSYISQLQEAINSNDIKEAERLQKEIIAVFANEIDNIDAGLDNGKSENWNSPVDFIGNAKLLKGKLDNYRINIKKGMNINPQRHKGINITQQVTQQVKNDIRISFEQTISQIHEIPEDALSDEEKDILCGKLTAIELSKDKKSRWSKVQDALKWIAEKGIEVGTAALPYILKAIEGGTV